MKVLLLTQSFPPPSSAGSVQYLYNIFSKLPPQTATIVTGNADPERSKHFDSQFPQRIIRLPFVLHAASGHKATRIARLCEYLLWPIYTFAIILRDRPQLIMIGEFNVTAAVAIIAKKLQRIPFVLFTYAEEITYIAKRPLYLRLLRPTLRNAAAIVVVSDYTRKVIEELGADPARIQKILPAVAQDKVTVSTGALESLREKYGLMGHRVLLTVGRLVERKGHATVIEALPAIRSLFPSTAYIIVGSGPEQMKLRALVRQSGQEDCVIFAGGVDDAELTCWYELCDVFVMPHRTLPAIGDTEGCPTVFLEAGAHGKPVIGGKDGGVADAILDKRTGLIIDGTDPAALAESVCHLLAHPEQSAAFGQAGREYASALQPESRAATIQALISRLTQTARTLRS